MKITDKRGQSQQAATPASPSTSPVPTSPDSPIIQANADGSLKEVEKTEPEVLLLAPFSDGTCLKMVARPWPGPAMQKPLDYDQHPQFVLLNSARQQLAVVRNEQVAHLFCDSVNLMFAAQEMADQTSRTVEQEATDLTNAICRPAQPNQ